MSHLALEIMLLVCRQTQSIHDLVELSLVSKAWRAAAIDEQVWRPIAARLRIDLGRGLDSAADAELRKLTSREAVAQHVRRYPKLTDEFAVIAPAIDALAAELQIDYKSVAAQNADIRSLFANGDGDDDDDVVGDDTTTALSFDNSDMRTPVHPWKPVFSTCSRSEKLLLLLYHIYTPTNSRQLHDTSIGLFGTNRCYDDVYAMHLLPYLSVKHLHLPHPDPPSTTTQTQPRKIETFLRFASCQLGEFMALVTSGTLEGRVIRYARVSNDLDRMGPIPRGTLPFMDLGLFEDWFVGFCASVCERGGRGGIVERQRRIETVLGRGGRELSLPSVFLEAGKGTGVAVTNGIKVHVSSFFLLSMARVCYRISLEYIPGECSYKSAQLQLRKWRFKYLNGRVERVQGEGVIGFFPLLSETHRTFTYCSYSDGGRVMDDSLGMNEIDYDPYDPYAEGRSLLRNPVVSLEGEFAFVPGSIGTPSGEPFDVAIPFVAFVRPDTVPVL